MVWKDGVNGFQQLSPDRPFASVPYSFTSKSADSVKSGAITTAQLNEQIQIFKAGDYPPHRRRPDLYGQTVTPAIPAEGKYLSYQWYKNGQPIAGATDDRYVIEDINKTQHDEIFPAVSTILISHHTTTHHRGGRHTHHTPCYRSIWK